MVCAHAVRVGMGKLEGVESIEVSLNEGTATLKLKRGNRVDPETIRQIVLDNGFTPSGAAVRVVGRLFEQDGAAKLEVEEVGRAYALEAHPEAERRFRELKGMGVGAILILEAYIAEAEERSTLRVRDFALEREPRARLSHWYLREPVTSRFLTDSSHSGSTKSGASSVSPTIKLPSRTSSIQKVRPFSRTW